jgi:hypothetical protein
MNARRFVLPPTEALSRLADFLEETGSPMSPREAAAAAIDQWIAAERAQVKVLSATPTRGYQWKSLFLPEGTELRMHFARQDYHARVIGEHIVYDGQRVSPRQMTIAVAGSGHNAWRELWVRLPDDGKWRPASLLRRQGEQQGVPQPVSPLEAMESAAASMTQTLRIALTLVEHARTQALPKYERRVERHRRAQDELEDSCQLD